ncbi:MAG TPA: GNAT family N-acetyltransferase [Gaiellaceae bacterium]|nr:GNAT family N-acetyltransferase [Gaiellaceae bacterium]
MDAVALCADTTADWHASWLTALGLRSERRDSVWRAVDLPPFIYWTAITLAPDVPASAVRDAQGTLCDSWSVLELGAADRDGFVERAREPWFLRPARELPAEEAPSELEVVRVSTPAEVAEFEEVSVRGFGGDAGSVEPGTFHPPSILADERMTMLTGRVAGDPVAAAMAYRTDTAVGIYGVTTIAPARGRGYASALTRALMDPGLPAVLSPSPEAQNLYRRLGFEQVGELRQWRRR